MWRTACSIAFIIQLISQGLLLFLLEPGYDISEGAYQALKVLSLVYAGASLAGGLVYTGWITIGMALVAAACVIVLTLAMWKDPAPLGGLLTRD